MKGISDKAIIFDLGGIAKGYAVDQAVAKIKNLSLDSELSCVVNAGGDLYMWGDEVNFSAAQVLGESMTWLKPFKISETAIATSSVRSSNSSINLSRAAHVKMPEGKILEEPRTVTVFARNCILADALTKIVLLGSSDLATQCLSLYEAKAIELNSDGEVEKVIG